jgi:hypothetical protein
VSTALPAEFVKYVAALCRSGEAAVAFVTAEGPSYCVASEPTARAVAEDASTTQPEECDTLLAVAVIGPDGTVTEYPIAA